MIIAVGFKVNFERAVLFRKWVNEIAMTYTIKGWVIDEERLKKGRTILTKQYFEEQLEKIREIRMSECLFYQKVADLYATAVDYDTGTSNFLISMCRCGSGAQERCPEAGPVELPAFVDLVFLHMIGYDYDHNHIDKPFWR